MLDVDRDLLADGALLRMRLVGDGRAVG